MRADPMVSQARAVDASAAVRSRRRLGRAPVAILLSAIAVVAISVVALAVGRFPIAPADVLRVLLGRILPLGVRPDTTEQSVVLLLRMPRVLLGLLVGGGLSVAGAALQAVFRNPLVSPEIIGVSAGASFGGALALLFGLSSVFLVGGAFGFGLLALVLLFSLTLGRGGAPMLMVVLGGVITGSFFSALVSLVTYIADPYTTLPAIVFWLLGSVAGAGYPKVVIAAIPVLAGVAVMVALRWRINVMSLSDDEARSLGLRPGRLRWIILIAAALIVAGAVAVSGVISWVGLVIPHLVRMWLGPDHRILLPVSFLVGAAFLVGIDTIARTVTAGEIPLGVLTALIGAPAFFVVLRRNRNRIWDSA